MYILKHIQGKGLFYLTTDKEYIVGRKNADIIINDDHSISRKHALISVKGHSVFLSDCDSKYGTFHNSKKVSSKNDVILRPKDAIKFGMFESKYEVQVVDIVTAASGLTQEQKNELKNKLQLVGGSLVSHWNNTCTYLTTHEIILTVKVLHALIDDKPMVTPQYWDEFLKNVKDAKPPPNTEDFKPQVTEALINRIDLSVNPSRKILFKGKVFVFPTEKIKKKMADLITKAGGNSISWEKQPLSLLEVSKSKNKYIFIRDETDEVHPLLQDIHQHLTKFGERMIPIQEIAMAIVFCSCEKDCNPKFNRLHSVFKVQPDSESDIFSLAPNTPSEDGWYDAGITKKEIVIPESLEVGSDLFAMPTPPTPISSTSKPSTSKVVAREQPETNNTIKKPMEPPKTYLEKVSTVKSSTNTKTLLGPPGSVPSTSENPPRSSTSESRFSGPAAANLQKESSAKPSNNTLLSPPIGVPSTSKNGQECDDPQSRSSRLDDSWPRASSSSGSSWISTDTSAAKKRPAEESLTSASKRNPFFPFANQEPSSEGKKRKADETLGSTRKKKTKANPFAFLKQKRDEADNPFVALRVKREADEEDEDNEFLQILKKQPQPTVTVDDDAPIHIKPLTYSGNRGYVPSECSKIKWLSTTVKREDGDKSVIKQEVDPEFQEIFEKFKDTVVIESIPATSFRIVPLLSASVSVRSSGDRKNFKKFRKVQPRHPQTTILVTSFREPGNDENSILLSDGEEQEDDVVEVPVQPVVRPAALKCSTSIFKF